jgi:hypothetical protein
MSPPSSDPLAKVFKPQLPGERFIEDVPVGQGADEESVKGRDESGGAPQPVSPEEARERARASLQTRRTSIAKTPVEPITRLFLAGKPVATSGNIVTLVGKAKTAKSAATGGAVSAVIAAMTGKTDLDTLGFTASNPSGHAVLVFDTEQSPYDAFLCYQRILNRAETEKDPEWLYHYALVGYSNEQIKEAMTIALEDAKQVHNGVFFVILDGVADIALSVNDEAEAKVIQTFLRSLAVEFDCPIATVIHSNESVKAGDDARGHLGKELMRKAESNLLIKKSGEVTTITSEKQRKAPITVEDGVAFKWSNAEGRHISCNTNAASKEAEKAADLRDLANEVFGDRTAMKWADLKNGIMGARECSTNTADRKVAEMRRLGVVETTFGGLYQRVS